MVIVNNPVSITPIGFISFLKALLLGGFNSQFAIHNFRQRRISGDLEGTRTLDLQRDRLAF